MTKFKDGDKVIIRRDNPKTPKWILRGLRLNNPRIIQTHFYSKTQQHTLYYLGCNDKGIIDISYIPFRASQFKLWIKGKIGRPREKREYQKKGSGVAH